MIPDCSTLPFVHVNWIEVRLSAVALKPVGASGARPVTTIAVLDVVDKTACELALEENLKR